MVFESWMILPNWMNLNSLPNHYSTNFIASFLSIYAPSSESHFSDILNPLKAAICQILSQIKYLSLWWIFIIMNFPDTNILSVIGGKKILKNLKLILTILELTLKIIDLKWAFLLLFLNSLRFNLSSFTFCLIFSFFYLFWLFILDLYFFLSFKFNFERLFSTKNNFTEIFAKNRNWSNEIEPSHQVSKFFPLSLCDN